jgi:hypothetical protein
MLPILDEKADQPPADDVDSEDQPPMTDPDFGLNDAAAEAARAKYGPNEIPVVEVTLYMMFLRQFVCRIPSPPSSSR